MPQAVRSYFTTKTNTPRDYASFGDIEQYTVQKLTTKLHQYGREALEDEYRKRRNVQLARLRRMGKSEWSRTESYRSNVNKFIAPSKLSDDELVRALHELDKFQRSQYSSVTGLRSIRDKYISTMHVSGFNFINEKNYFDFIDFMSVAMELAKNLQVTSDQVVTLYEELQQSTLSWRDIFKDYAGDDNNTLNVFEWWIDEQKKIKARAALMEQQKQALINKAKSGATLTREERRRYTSFTTDSSSVAFRKLFKKKRRR